MGFYSKKLICRLREEYNLDFPSDIKIYNCRPGWSTLSGGGFKWTFSSIEEVWPNSFGSQYTVRECAIANKISLYSDGCDTFIDIED